MACDRFIEVKCGTRTSSALGANARQGESRSGNTHPGTGTVCKKRGISADAASQTQEGSNAKDADCGLTEGPLARPSG
jgi:hypothetical protein